VDEQSDKLRGAVAIFATPVFLGMAPIFGKLAINANADPFTVAAIRTLIAVIFLWCVYAVFFPRYIFIYPAGLMGCVVIGIINGIGSLFYYGGLNLLDASVVQLINGVYLIFALLISHIGGQHADKQTLVRVLLAMLALVMITGFSTGPVNLAGVGFMLGSALMFAGTLILSQYVLYEMPARTATLYILSTMAVVVTMVWLAVSEPLSAEVVRDAAPPIVLLGITTALSRLAMFAGVKLFGGMQTAILAISEIAVALLLAFLVLGEVLTLVQWLGVLLLFFTIALIRQKDLLTHGFNPNLLIVANMSSVQFQRIAFHRAFGTHDLDDELGTMAAVTTQEMRAIQQMMGAEDGALDPFPIGKLNKLSVQTQLDVVERQLEEMRLSLPRETPNARLQEMPRVQADEENDAADDDSGESDSTAS
jgi:drug/metabolite transporter (DMT)-like permease